MRRPWAAARTCKAPCVYEAKPERAPTSPPLTRCHTGLSASPLLLCYPHPTWDPAAPPTARSVRSRRTRVAQTWFIAHPRPRHPLSPPAPWPRALRPHTVPRRAAGPAGAAPSSHLRSAAPAGSPRAVPHGAPARGPARGRTRQGSRGCREAPRCASTARRLTDFYHCVVPHRPGGPQLPTQPPKGVWVASGPWPSRAKPRCSFADRLCVDRRFQIS